MNANEIYVDPSALRRLYVSESWSREMVSWRRRVKGPLKVTHHGRTEIVNSIGLAMFQQRLTQEDGVRAWTSLDYDFQEGWLVQADILWRAALNRASDLSKKHTPSMGGRALDVLHVGCALELGAKRFLSFDQRQQQLAKAVGLRIINI